MESWGHGEETKVSELTVKELDAMCAKFTELKDKLDKKKEELSELEKEAKAIEFKIIETLQSSDKKSWEGEFGKLGWVQRSSYKQPENMDKKLELFAYLRGKGIFNELVSVNSNTLSSWAAQEIKAHEERGEYGWLPPGIGEPSMSYYLRRQK